MFLIGDWVDKSKKSIRFYLCNPPLTSPYSTSITSSHPRHLLALSLPPRNPSFAPLNFCSRSPSSPTQNLPLLPSVHAPQLHTQKKNNQTHPSPPPQLSPHSARNTQKTMTPASSWVTKKTGWCRLCKHLTLPPSHILSSWGLKRCNARLRSFFFFFFPKKI